MTLFIVCHEIILIFGICFCYGLSWDYFNISPFIRLWFAMRWFQYLAFDLFIIGHEMVSAFGLWLVYDLPWDDFSIWHLTLFIVCHEMISLFGIWFIYSLPWNYFNVWLWFVLYTLPWDDFDIWPLICSLFAMKWFKHLIYLWLAVRWFQHLTSDSCIIHHEFVSITAWFVYNLL